MTRGWRIKTLISNMMTDLASMQVKLLFIQFVGCKEEKLPIAIASIQETAVEEGKQKIIKGNNFAESVPYISCVSLC